MLTVPDVTGQAYVFAKSILQEHGFAWHVTGPVLGYAANTVASQRPAPGTIVLDTGAPTVTLTLARNTAYVEKGTPENDAPYAGTEIRMPANVAQRPRHDVAAAARAGAGAVAAGDAVDAGSTLPAATTRQRRPDVDDARADDACRHDAGRRRRRPSTTPAPTTPAQTAPTETTATPPAATPAPAATTTDGDDAGGHPVAPAPSTTPPPTTTAATPPAPRRTRRLRGSGRSEGAGRYGFAARPCRGARRLGREAPRAERGEPQPLAVRARVHRRRRPVRLVARRRGAAGADRGGQAGRGAVGRRQPDRTAAEKALAEIRARAG